MSAETHKALRRWAFAAGFIESELDTAVSRMHAAIRAEVLEEAALAVEGGWGPVAARQIRRLLGKDTGGQPAGESTQPAPAQVWYLFEEDAPTPVTPRLYTTQAAAEQGTIDRYQAGGEYSPDYSWRPHEDGARELLAGGDPVGIYLAPVPVCGTPPDLSAPDFFQPGRTYAHANYRFQCLYHVTHPVTGEMHAWGWFGKATADGRRHLSFGRGQWEARTWDDITEGGDTR